MTRDGEVLTTDRLTLRRPCAADADWIAREIARPDVHRMLTAPPFPYARADAVAWLEGAAGAAGHYVIETSEPVGVVTLRPHQKGGELGYWLAQDHWGHGYMTEAAGAVLEQHFAESEAAVPSGYIIDNPASANVLTKLGFCKDGTRDTHCHARQADVTIQKMRLTAEQWAARNPPRG